MTPSSSVKLSSPEFSSEQKVQPHSSALVPHGSHSGMPVNKLSTIPPSSPLPFPKVSNSWYHHRGELAGANEAREQLRKQTQPTSLDGVLLSLYQSRVTGTLEENLAFLLKKKDQSQRKQGKLEVIIQLGKILKSGSLLPTKILMDVYYSTKGKLSEESPSLNVNQEQIQQHSVK